MPVMACQRILAGCPASQSQKPETSMPAVIAAACRRARVPAGIRGARLAAGEPVTIRVLVADDQALVRAGIRMLIETQPDLEVVGEAADGMAAVSEVTRSRPDVVLMDVRMPRLDGIEAARQIMALGPDPAKVVMLTTFDVDEYVFDALSAGATGFLLKQARPEELLFGIRATP